MDEERRFIFPDDAGSANASHGSGPDCPPEWGSTHPPAAKTRILENPVARIASMGMALRWSRSSKTSSSGATSAAPIPKPWHRSSIAPPPVCSCWPDTSRGTRPRRRIWCRPLSCTPCAARKSGTQAGQRAHATQARPRTIARAASGRGRSLRGSALGLGSGIGRRARSSRPAAEGPGVGGGVGRRHQTGADGGRPGSLGERPAQCLGRPGQLTAARLDPRRLRPASDRPERRARAGSVGDRTRFRARLESRDRRVRHAASLTARSRRPPARRLEDRLRGYGSTLVRQRGSGGHGRAGALHAGRSA